MGKRFVLFTSLVVALLGFVSTLTAQTTYTWTQTGTGGNWSTATWDASAPVEADDTIIRFFAGTSGGANTVTATFTATNNIETGGFNGSSFDLESLILNGTSTANQTITINPTGNTRLFRFVGDANSIIFNNAGSLAYDIVNNITFSNGLTITTNSNTNRDKRLSGVISGSGGLTLNGSGRVTLNNANTYSGGTIIESGTVILGNDGSLGTGTLTMNGGVLSNTGLFSSGDPGTNSRDLAINVVFGGDVQIINFNIQQGHYSLGSSTRTLDLGGATRVITTDSTATNNATTGNTVTFLGAVHNGGLTKSGRGGLRLSSASSSYTGVTTVRMGTLTIANNALVGVNSALGNATSAVQLGDESTSDTNTIRLYIGGGDFEVGRDINVNNYNTTGITSIGGAGDVNVTYSGQITLNRAVDLLSSSVGGNAVHFTGNIIGNFDVSIGGVGTVRFANGKSYTGVTTVTAGATLQVDGSINNSAVSVAGTLSGNGSTGAVAVQSGGTISPGASIGQMTTGTLDMTAGGTYAVEINTTSSSADRINVFGDLLLAGDQAMLTLTDLGGNVDPVGPMVLIRYTGNWDGGLFKLNDVALADGSQFVFGTNTYTIDYDHMIGDGVRAVTIVPEPASLALLGLAGAGLLSWRQRRTR